MKKVFSFVWLLMFSLISALLFFYISDYWDIDVSWDRIISEEIEKLWEDYDFDDPDFDIEIIFEDNIDDEISDNLSEEEKKELREEIEAQRRIEILRNRFALQWTIRSWDEYIEKGLPLLALSQYLRALNSSPNDPMIIEKLADTYFSINRFSQAANTYYRIKDTLWEEKKQNLIKSIVFSTSPWDRENIRLNWRKIEELNINRHDKVFYINSLNCTINYNWCIEIFQNYINENEEINSIWLNRIKNALENFTNFQTERDYYRDVLILWALFTEWLYNISAYLWERILNEMPDYRTVLLIVWESYFNLWQYEKARKHLWEYFILENNDMQVAYMLWVINLRLRDYIRSNIHFNQVLQSDFEDRSSIKRVLAYNHYLLWNKRQMLNTLDKLVELPDSEITDFSLNIYYSILEKREQKAIDIANKWIEKFEWIEGREIFYWYLWWVYREKWELDKARDFLIKWLRINPRNPMINLNMWYLEERLENLERALIYFKRTSTLDTNWEFWKLAEIEIESIEKYLEIKKD